MALFESRGYKCEVVESYNSFTKRKKDMFGILDMVAIGNEETLGIQMTSKNNMSSRIKKIQESDYFVELLRSKWRIIVIGWFKKPNGRYDFKEFEF
jgi:hypothetical protein